MDSWKTFSMQGELETKELRGVIPNAFDHIFEHISARPAGKFLVRCSYLEVIQAALNTLTCHIPFLLKCLSFSLYLDIQ